MKLCRFSIKMISWANLITGKKNTHSTIDLDFSNETIRNIISIIFNVCFLFVSHSKHHVCVCVFRFRYLLFVQSLKWPGAREDRLNRWPLVVNIIFHFQWKIFHSLGRNAHCAFGCALFIPYFVFRSHQHCFCFPFFSCVNSLCYSCLIWTEVKNTHTHTLSTKLE